MAEGNHGCRPNCADFPVAANNRPVRGRFRFLWSVMRICCRSQVFRLARNQAMAKMNPTSPIRLYKMACSAAVLASVRPYHHPISRNDIMPTPSHPINS